MNHCFENLKSQILVTFIHVTPSVDMCSIMYQTFQLTIFSPLQNYTFPVSKVNKTSSLAHPSKAAGTLTLEILR
jgi:hypothetical protein